MTAARKPWRWGQIRGPGLRTLSGPVRTLGGRPGTEGPNANVYRSKQWRALRDELVRRHPFCARCGTSSGRMYADHKVELRDGGPAFDPSNIEILCAGCHAKKTAAEQRRRRGLA
jgi:ribosomal protein S27AE